MVEPARFLQSLREHGIRLFAGVPDSLLKDFCAYMAEHAGSGEHVITANEGNAVALAAGYHLGTGSIAAVYMQNSGLGNAINALTSLADPEVYRIPMLLIIGWRGEPGIKDEPQHVKQGRITPAQLDLLGIPYGILDGDSDTESLLNGLLETVRETGAPVALLVRKGAFAQYRSRGESVSVSNFEREAALKMLLALADPSDLIISTTGKTSRELYELRVARLESPHDFLTVGSMGHASSIALGVALGRPDRRVICFDGDGALLMHFGAVPVIGKVQPSNLVHIVLNNGVHESVGGQPTGADKLSFEQISRACGYKHYCSADSPEILSRAWRGASASDGPVMLEVRLCPGSRGNLGRPESGPEENKHRFMEHARGM